jgi:hypothetical protein
MRWIFSMSTLLIGEGDHSHRRLGLVERHDLDRQPLARRLRGRDRGPITEFLVPAGQKLEHGLGAGPFGEIDVEPFGFVIALVQGDEEWRVLALELPGEAHRQFFGCLRKRRLPSCRYEQGSPGCDDQPPHCRSHIVTS